MLNIRVDCIFACIVFGVKCKAYLMEGGEK